MRYTNNLGLPEAIVEAVKNDKYSKGDSHISITGLIAPPRIRVLKKLHEKELEEDVSDRIWSLLGQVTHGILERANKQALSEERFYIEIDGVKVSGQLDAYYNSGLVQDYKLVSLYQVKDGVKKEYEQQLNSYAALLRHNNLVVNKLELVCILRDWSKTKARQDETILQQQVVKLDVPLWSPEEALEFLTERVKIHKAANYKLPLCSDEDRWATPDKYAVMPKKGAPRSLKNYDLKEEAEAHAKRVPGAFVELRPGENKRCQDYCPVSKYCTQYQKLKEKK